MNIQHLARRDICIHGFTQARMKLNQDTVEEYSEQYATDASVMPPLKVYFDGKMYWLADGFHRYHAAKQAEIGSLDCDVVTGTLREARIFALGANSNHGLRRTHADKRKAVGMALADDFLSPLSNRKLAEICGVSNAFISKERSKPSGNVTTSEQTPETEENQRSEVNGEAESVESKNAPGPIDQELVNDFCQEVDRVIDKLHGYDLEILEVVGAHFIREMAELKKNL